MQKGNVETAEIEETFDNPINNSFKKDMASITDRFNRKVRKLNEEKDLRLLLLRERYDREIIACLRKYTGRRVMSTD